MRYVVTSGNVRLGEVDASSDLDFQDKLESGVNFYIPLFFNVWTDNPFTRYPDLKKMPPPPELTFVVNPGCNKTTTLGSNKRN